MGNPVIGQILGSVLRGAAGGGGGGLGRGLPGGLDSVLGGMLGGGLPGMGSTGVPGARPGNRNAMLALMLPLVLAWMRRNGGVRNVMSRVNEHGYAPHASSWLGTERNDALPADAAHQLLGDDELSAWASQLGIGRDEAAQGFADVLPEVVDQLSPQGHLPDDADDRLDAGQSALDEMLRQRH
ncbi:YidB family protein [Ramlibacter algicola]|uniref:DUF937 domain-containing protein n=1 Tax=Ramlibacter algicola TaxID=2795217 RepID=A0A934Q3M6_9BURK|nr:YidB family protein [Ramlibacter algicola]MBK0393659.1 DUF937 domain-containing protein [Ramlibacter algicola]